MNRAKIKAEIIRDAFKNYKDYYDYKRCPHDIKVSLADDYYANVLPFVEDAIDFTLDAVEKELERKDVNKWANKTVKDIEIANKKAAKSKLVFKLSKGINKNGKTV